MTAADFLALGIQQDQIAGEHLGLGDAPCLFGAHHAAGHPGDIALRAADGQILNIDIVVPDDITVGIGQTGEIHCHQKSLFHCAVKPDRHILGGGGEVIKIPAQAVGDREAHGVFTSRSNAGEIGLHQQVLPVHIDDHAPFAGHVHLDHDRLIQHHIQPHGLQALAAGLERNRHIGD